MQSVRRNGLDDAMSGGGHRGVADSSSERSDWGQLGRPVPVELGHDAACTQLQRDQAADDQERRARIPA
jgi:hypothetical protein